MGKRAMRHEDLERRLRLIAIMTRLAMEEGRYGVMVNDADPMVAWVDERVPYGMVCDRSGCTNAGLSSDIRRASRRRPIPLVLEYAAPPLAGINT